MKLWIGLLILLTLLGSCLMIGYSWMSGSPIQVPTEQFAGSQSLAVVHLEELEPNSGLDVLVREVIAQSRRSRSPASKETQWLLDFLGLVEPSDGRQPFFRDRLREATLTLEPDARSAPAWVAVVNLQKLSRLIRIAYQLGVLLFESTEFHGYDLLTVVRRGESTVTFVDHTLIWAETEVALQQALENAAVEKGMDSLLLEVFETRDAKWNLFAVVANRQRVLASLAVEALEVWLDPADAFDRDALQAEFLEIEFVQVGFRSLEERTVAAEFRFDCTSDLEARAFRERLRLGVFLAEPMWRREGLAVHTDIRVERDSVVLDARIENF